MCAAPANKSWSDHQELISQVLSYAKKAEFSSGDAVLSPETEKEVFYYIDKGTVDVSYTGARQTRITVALIGVGEFFGEIGFLTRDPEYEPSSRPRMLRLPFLIRMSWMI